jgi:HAMP domain-containing protein
MTRFFRNRLAVQLGIPYVVFVLIVLSVLVFANFTTYYGSVQDAHVVPVQEASQLQIKLDNLLKIIDTSSQFVARNIGDNLEHRTFLQDVINNNPTIVELTFFSPDGAEILKVTKPTVGPVTDTLANAKGVSFFETAMRKERYIGDPFITSENNQFVFWAYPVRNVLGEVTGVMRTTIDLSALWDTVSQTNLGTAYIVDAKGTTLVSSRLEDIQNTKLQTNEGVRAFIRRETGVFEYVNTAGEKVVASWRLIPPTPWAVIVEVPVAQLFMPVYRLLLVFFGLLILVIAVSGYQVYNLNRRVFEPLLALQKGTEQISEGKLDGIVETHAHNEFDSLATTFNGMTTRLREVYQNLEQKVRERTTELQEAKTILDTKVAELKKTNDFMIDRELKMVELKRKVDELESRQQSK